MHHYIATNIPCARISWILVKFKLFCAILNKLTPFECEIEQYRDYDMTTWEYYIADGVKGFDCLLKHIIAFFSVSRLDELSCDDISRIDFTDMASLISIPHYYPEQRNMLKFVEEIIVILESWNNDIDQIN